MARRPRKTDPEILRQKLVELLQNFEVHLRERNLRTQVLELVPANYLLRDLGSSLLDGENAKSARDRILLYLNKHVGRVIHGDELMIVAGISEYGRRIRELRVQFGWAIISGMTVKDMRANAEDEDVDETAMIPEMTPDQYMLVTVDQDLEAALRWNLANEVRKDKTLSIREKILHHLRTNVGKAVNGEELRYVAENKSEWARRTSVSHQLI